MNPSYSEILSTMNTIKDIQASSAVLGWDQETYMPEGSALARSEQLATLDTLAHRIMVSDSTAKLVDQADSIIKSGDMTVNARLVMLFVDEVEKARKLSEDLVRETSKATALAQESWKKARATNSFSTFEPDLSRLVDLKRQAADCYGYTTNRYDALLNLFEPGMTVDLLKPVFQRLQQGTTTLLKKIEPVSHTVNNSILLQKFSREKQLDFARKIAESIGFNFNQGRVDLSAHPFCTSFAPTDVRLTTRVFDNDLRSCLFGLIHETGHGMYEQGFASELTRTFGADGASMGIHESQSLFWENVIARSEEFWQWALPMLKDYFPEQLHGVTPYDFYKAINTIEPSLIRIESDELTYNIHIIIRFEIEEQLINGTLPVEAVPTVWNAKMEEYLGVVPPSDSKGCLQDIHWSFGGFGYFPSYTLGKLYAAMLRKSMLESIPDVSDQIRRGNFRNILDWLRTNIHQYGKTRTPHELITSISGRSLTETDFMEYVEAKANRVYGI